MNAIGTLNEKPLHASLKEWCARPGDRFETPVEGYVIDIVRDQLLIEIQTANFSSIKRKIQTLTETRRLRLVYPIAVEKWILRLGADGSASGRRKSPKRGALAEIFRELVRFPKLIANPNFSLEVLLISEEEVRRNDRTRGWRKGGWITHERRLLDVVDRKTFEKPADYVALIPRKLSGCWTTADLASAMKVPRWLAQKMTYCLREACAVGIAGKKGNSILYRLETNRG
jgi:hypothetical protein